MSSEINAVSYPEIAQVTVEQNVPKPKRAQSEPLKEVTNRTTPFGKNGESNLGKASVLLDNQLDESSEAINTALFERTNQKLKFSEDEKTGKMIIQIVDKESEDVIRQIPAQQFLDLIYNINKVASAVLKDLPRFV
jgi:uncharacterized FlaG/YvyC family protein